jgi:hypothetical protein
MKIVIAVLIILLVATTAYAGIRNPIDAAGDTIRKNTNDAVDDAMSKFKIGLHDTAKEIIQGAKEFIEKVLGLGLEIFTVVAVGWMFSFLVDKKTAKMVKFVTIVCGITQFIKLFL